MSKSNAFEDDLLKLIFLGTPIANLADNAAAAPLTNLYIALHTADPGEAGDQTTNEIAYTGYARVAVARGAGGWSEAGGTINPVAAITFGAMTAGAGGTVTHFSVGVAAAGASKILYSGPVTPNIVVGNGVTPQLSTATAITED